MLMTYRLSGREYAIPSPGKWQLIGVALLLLVLSLGCQDTDRPAAPATERDGVSAEQPLLSDSPAGVPTTSASPNTGLSDLNTSGEGPLQHPLEEEHLPSPLVNELPQAVNHFVEKAREREAYQRHIQMLSRIMLKPDDEQEALLSDLSQHLEELTGRGFPRCLRGW